MKQWLGLSVIVLIGLSGCSSKQETQPEPSATSVPTSTIAVEPNDSVDVEPAEVEPDDGTTVEVVLAEDAFSLVMGWLADEPLSEADYESLFDTEFRHQVPFVDFVGILDQLSEAGPWRSVENQVLTDSEMTSTIESSVDGVDPLSVSLAVGDGKIVALFFAPGEKFEPPSTVDAAVTRLEAMGTLNYAVFDRTGGTCAVVSEQGADQQMALGSMFKLYVLYAVQIAVDEGELDWGDPVTIRDEFDSFPSGSTQDVEPGTTLTVRELAELMISISDNTATDHLIHLVSSEAVEAAVVASGHSRPDLLTPFMTTRQFFILKTVFTEAERDGYIAAGADDKRVFLDTKVAETPLGSVADLVWPGPIDVDTLEWFASPADICRVFSALTSTSETREILSLNPGVPDTGDRWDYIGFKGGSEPGVLAMSWYVESSSGEEYVVAGSVTNSASPLNETEAAKLFAVIRDLLATTS